MPFALKIATLDHHLQDHISFYTNHLAKDSSLKPFTSTITVTHPDDLPLTPAELDRDVGSSPIALTTPIEETFINSNNNLPPPPHRTRTTPRVSTPRTYNSLLWPPHCIQSTPGSNLHPSLSTTNLTHLLPKGQNPLLEMYSAFGDPLGAVSTGLAELLREYGVTDVYVVGLAGDFCVKDTALGVRKEGFGCVVVEEGTRCTTAEAWEGVKGELRGQGAEVASLEGDAVRRVRELRGEHKVE